MLSLDLRLLLKQCCRLSYMLIVTGGVAGPASVHAQQTMQMDMSKPMTDMRPVPPPDQLPAPIHMAGIGNSHIQIKANAEAQIWFDQGLNLLHDFWDYESAKAFEQAVRVDPNCAMCYWGLANAEGFRGSEQKVYGKKALAEAVRLEKHAGSAERLYIEAAQADADAEDGDSKPALTIFRRLVKKNPKDLQARIFLSNALEDGRDDAGEPKAGTKEAITILEGVLREAPNDSAANHYWIHAMEPGSYPERAIPSAALLASLAPTSGHMVHMPGHIYYRVGDYADAEHWFSASMTADETYMREQNVSPDDDWNYVHNMMYAIANLMEQGRLADANVLSDRLAGARGQLSATLYIWSARDQMSRLSHRLPVALRIGDWDGVLNMLAQAPPDEGEKTANLHFLYAELKDFATGMRALDHDQVSEAFAASDRMDAGLWRMQQQMDMTPKDDNDRPKDTKSGGAKEEKPVTQPVMPDASSGPLVKSLAVASMELRASVLADQGKLDASKKLFDNAAAAEKKLGYHEPPMYIRPVAETEAAALLKAKDYPGAKKAYEAALVERPQSGFELYGLARVQELSGDAAGARKSYDAFLKRWSTADPALLQVTHAREVVGASSLAAR